MTDTAARPSGPPPPIPLTIVTGFLGAGKTTLLNRLLRDPALADSVVIVNEFGEIGLDHLLVETATDGMLLLASGCLCCTVRQDLVATLEDLLRRRDNGRIAPFRRVVIETTGLADPAPVLQVTMAHPYLGLRYRLEGLVTVVDAINGIASLEAQPEAMKQIACADRIVLSKSDLCRTAAELERLAVLRRRIAALNPSAPVLDAAAPIDAAALLDCGLYDPATKQPDVARWLREEALGAPDHDHGHHHHDVNRHGEDIRAFALRGAAPVARADLDRFLDLLRLAHGPKLLRMKGIVAVREHPQAPLLVQAVQHVLHPPVTLPAWPDADRSTRLVFILRDLDEAFVAGLWRALEPA